MKLFTVVVYHNQRHKQVLPGKFLKMLFLSFIDSVLPQPPPPPPEIVLRGK